MKKTIILMLVMLILAASVAAQEVRCDANIVLNGTNSGNTYAVGDLVTQQGDVSGDLMVLTSQLNVEGTILKDLTAAAPQVTMTGVVGEDFRALGSQIRVDGLVFGDLMLIGSQINLQNKTNIGNDVYISGTDVYFDAIADENVKINAANVEWGPNAYIKGNLEVTDNIDVPEGIVAGKVAIKPYKSPLSNVFAQTIDLAGALLTLAMMLLLGVVLIWLFSGFITRSNITLKQRPLTSFFIGLATMILVPIVSGIIFITFVGIPISIMLFLVYVVILIMAPILAAITTGRFTMGLVNSKGTLLLNLLVGSILIILLSWIPLAGPIMVIILSIMSVGALVRNFFGKDKEKKKLKRKSSSRIKTKKAKASSRRTSKKKSGGRSRKLEV